MCKAIGGSACRALLCAAAMLAHSGCAFLGSPPEFANLFSSPPSLRDRPGPAAQLVKAEQQAAPSVAVAQVREPPPQRASARAARESHAGAQRSAFDCGSDGNCLLRLKALIEDPQHRWIGTAEPPAAYAQGIRLFAYRAMRAGLTCDELGRAISELAAVDAAHRQPVPGVSPAQARGVRLLNAHVAGELKAERTARCNA